jgi:CheY-like chemotaxis protein
MAEEFDRLDKDKKGELDAQELLRSNLLVKHARPEDVAGAWGVRRIVAVTEGRILECTAEIVWQSSTRSMWWGDSLIVSGMLGGSLLLAPQDGLVRVLLVEDFEPFRRFIRTTLQTELQIIAEVSDGLEAVRKAEELQPDLILLDIGLPTLNGIEAARQIHLLSPQSKILFVSQESSADVIEEAMNSGALGYVVKAHAATDLLDAVEAVCQGRRFVSGNGSSGH